MAGFSNNENNSVVDFSKIDVSIEKLVLAISAWNKSKNSVEVKKVPKPRVTKKLNVELIKKVILETKELQQKNNKNNRS